LRPWIDRALVSYIHRSPTQSVAALFDTRRIAEVFLRYMVQPATDTFVESFAWSNVKLADPLWREIARYIAVLALLGCIRWLIARRSTTWDSLRPALLFLALVGMLIWINTIFRPLPLLGEMYVVPAARYTFPAIIVTALADHLIARVRRGGVEWEQRFARGRALSGLKQVGPVRGSGTIITFHPDAEIFPSITFKPKLIAERLEAKAYLHMASL
jgi:hypothetical protein